MVPDGLQDTRALGHTPLTPADHHRAHRQNEQAEHDQAPGRDGGASHMSLRASERPLPQSEIVQVHVAVGVEVAFRLRELRRHGTRCRRTRPSGSRSRC